MKRAEEFGAKPVATEADLSASINRKARLIGEFADDRIHAPKDFHFTLDEERTAFFSSAKVQVGPHRLTAKAFMSSTGSVVSHVPIAGLEEVGYLTGDEASERRDSPQSMIVLGGGPVALKLAEFFHPIGTAVTLIQRSTHVTSQGDEDLARPVKARFREEGMTVSTHARLYRLTKDGTHNSGFSGERQNFGSPYCWAGSCGIDS